MLLNHLGDRFAEVNQTKPAASYTEESLHEDARSLERQSHIFETTLSSITDFAYLFDPSGRFVYSNRPLLDLLGITLKEIVGKNFFDLNYPDDLAARLQRQIQQVFDTGEIAKGETPFTSPTGAGGYYEYIFSPVAAADGSVELVAGLTRDITERKCREANLAFLAEISQDLMRLTNIDEIMQLVGAKIGTYLKLSACAFVEISEAADEAVIKHAWHREDVPGVVGVYRLEEFVTGEFQRAGRAGEIFVVSDTQTDSRTDAAAYAALQIGSFISVPLIRDGQWRFLLVIYRSTPHDWRTDEIETIPELTTRIWMRLERARAEEALRESEARYRTLFDSIDEGFCTVEVLFDDAGKAIDYRFLEANPAFEQQTGLENATGKTARQLVPQLEERWFEIYGKVALTGEAVRFEDESKPMNRWFDIFASRVGNETSRRVAIVFTDITNRKQMEIALREREQFISAVNDASPTLTYIFDLNTNSNLYVNQQVEKLFGYTPEEIKLLGADFTERLIHPDDRENAYQHFEHFAAERKSEVWEFEYRFRLKSGKWRWIRTYETVFRRDLQGKATEIIGVAMDVTESKQAEVALRESEERFRAMFEQANVGIVQLTIDGYLLAPNPGFCKIVGYEEEEARRLTVRDVTHPDDYERETELTRQLIAGEIPGYSIEKRYIRKDGVVVWGTMTATLVRDAGGEPFYTLSVIEDISERKAAEEAVRESEERLRLLVESASDYAIFTVTPDNIVDSWNKGAEKVFGYRESEIIGSSGEILFMREDRERGVPHKEIETALREGRAEDERWHIRKDGSRFFAAGVMRPLRDGKVEGFVKIARDQTERIQAEKTLRDKETLQKLVGAQEDERKRIARDLHDHLGQQLTALRLKLEAARKLCENDEELSAKIDETQLIARHIDDDVDFLAWQLRPAALDDLGLVAALENYVKEWSRHSGSTAEFYVSGLGKKRLAPEVETNLYRIAQEALNNILKHAHARSANLILEKRGSLIILIVEDDGTGFDVEDKYNRSTGLGLIGMQERAALVGGEIQIESTPDKGTTVFVRIPAEYSVASAV